MNRAWEELKKINWVEINNLCMVNYSFGLIGGTNTIKSMKEWIMTLPYELDFSREGKENNVLNEKIVVIDIEKGMIDRTLIEKLNFCIVGEDALSEIRKLNVDVYVFTKGNNSNLPGEILANHPDIRYGLSHYFPAFRVEHARSEINATAFQNTSWAIGTATPNAIPGPHQPITAPIEALSDFAVLTANEVKMIFELVGISGRKVNPAFCLVEFGIIFGFASVAQNIATNLLGKIPAGAGVIAKGGIAFAFTRVIGEAAILYLFTGKKVGKKYFEDNIIAYMEEGKKVAQNMMEQIRKREKAQ